MALNKGKKFEKNFKDCFLNTVPNASLDRLYDQVSGYKAISNICDFIGYSKPLIMYLECKSHKGNTFPLSNLSQYDKLVRKVGIPGVRTGVVIWFEEHDRIIYVPIKTITQMFKDGKKSVNIRTIDEEGYRFFNIPSVKKQTYMNSNYSILLTTQDGD